MKIPQQYIESKLNALKVIDYEKKQVNLSEAIYQIITSKKYRKYSISQEFQDHIKSVIYQCIANNKPIQFVWVFGGYKLWSLEESPQVDWAELFSFIYFVNWLKPITLLYKPGVHFDFFSDDVIVPIMNNVKQNDISSYILSFQNLVKFIKDYLPSGFVFDFNRVLDQYQSLTEFKSELDHNIKFQQEKYKKEKIKLTPQQIKAIDLNVITTKRETNNWRTKVQIIHDAYSMASKRRPYYRNKDKIMVNNTPISGAIAVGTTKTSVVKFWVGVGALIKKKDSYIETILSPTQIAKTKYYWEKIKISKLKGKNFSRIRIINSN